MSPGARAQLLVIGTLLVLAVAVRGAPVLSAGFPLNDGGLFVLMSDELRANGFVPPAYTSYDSSGIPYAYPPLGLYLTALAGSATGWSSIELARVLPLVESALAVLGFLLFARALLGTGRASLMALLAFALVPASFLWFVMGGGLTRAPGLACATLALRELVLFYRSGDWRHAALAAIAGGLTLLAHLQMAWFLAVSAAFLFVALDRTWKGLARSAAMAVGALAVAAPWWVLVVVRHGPEPFLAAFGARAIAAAVWTDIRGLRAGTEPLLPLIAVLALAGSLALIRQRQPVIAGWVLVVAFVDGRSSIGAAIPLAIGAAVGIDALARVRVWGPARSFLVVAGLVVLIFSAGLAGLALRPLSPDARSAMDWIDTHLPSNAQILVITGEQVSTDSASEWLPVLARRRSVATSQGHEWLRGEFARLIASHDEAEGCSSSDCLDEWSSRSQIAFDHVLLAPSWDRARCCAALSADLLKDSAYRLIHAEGDTLLFARD